MNSLPIASTVLLRKSKESNLEDKNIRMVDINNCDQLYLDPVKEEEAYPDSSAIVLVTVSSEDTKSTKIVASMTFGQIASLKTYFSCFEFASKNTQSSLAFIRM